MLAGRIPDAVSSIVFVRRKNTVNEKSLYQRLGKYDGITAFVDDLLPRLQGDSQLGRFWQNRGDDGLARERQLLIDFLCSGAGGPMYYTGRDMKTSHQGMMISDTDWSIFLDHAGATLKALQVPQQECDDVVGFVLSLKDEMVEA
jgi:hemoglobin